MKFFIESLECAYNQKTVFAAENLVIPKKKLTIILGSSGSGKSTLIEALGLMNNTMTGESKVTFYPEKGKVIRLNNLWPDREKREHRI